MTALRIPIERGITIELGEEADFNVGPEIMAALRIDTTCGCPRCLNDRWAAGEIAVLRLAVARLSRMLVTGQRLRDFAPTPEPP